jgi:hypothetical protein
MGTRRKASWHQKPFSVGDVPSWVREWAHLLVEERVGAGAPCRLVMYATDPDYKSTYVKSKKPRADGSKTLRTGVTREELAGVKNRIQTLDDRVKTLEGENQALTNQVKALDDRVKTLEFVSAVWGHKALEQRDAVDQRNAESFASAVLSPLSGGGLM